MKKLTARQMTALKYICKHTESNGCAPTLRELCQYMGYRAVGSAQDVISSLRKKGYLIQPDRQLARSLILTDLGKKTARSQGATIHTMRTKRPVSYDEDSFRIPILGSVPAGHPMEAIEHAIGNLLVSPSLLPRPLPRPESLFGLRAQGVSMIGAGILNGDWLIVKSQKEAPVGSIVVARAGEEATVKRLMKDPQRGWYLKAENPDFDSIYAAETPFQIIGQVLALQRVF